MSRQGKRAPKTINGPTHNVPALFSAVCTKTITPRDVARAQNTFNETALYAAIEAYAKEWFRGASRPARVLELCSSSGLCAMRVKRAIEVERVTLVDINPDALAIARRRFRSQHVSTIVEDAVTYASADRFDLILLNSAYHHIAGHRKLRLLANAAKHLAPGGRVLLGDHFLPPYRRRVDFRRAVVAFYAPLVEELLERKTHRHAVEIIRQAAYQCWNGVTEFKVSWAVFSRHLEASGLVLASHQIVWRPKSARAYNFPVGSVAAALRQS